MIRDIKGIIKRSWSILVLFWYVWDREIFFDKKINYDILMNRSLEAATLGCEIPAFLYSLLQPTRTLIAEAIGQENRRRASNMHSKLKTAGGMVAKVGRRSGGLRQTIASLAATEWLLGIALASPVADVSENITRQAIQFEEPCLIVARSLQVKKKDTIFQLSFLDNNKRNPDLW